jgi:hypothetical protein
MGLDLNRLEKVRRRGSNTIARCPACSEAGGDRKGEHLFINNSGHFGCVLYPGADGQTHRQRIFELVGSLLFGSPGPVVIQNDILGHLGHFNSTHARKSLNIPVLKTILKKTLNNPSQATQALRPNVKTKLP